MKNICFAKGEDAVDHRTVSTWFQKFHSGYKKLNNQAKSSMTITVDSVFMLQVTETNSASSTQIVLIELSI